MTVSTLPPPLSGRQRDLEVAGAGRIAWYAERPAAPTVARPLVLVHSINAAASAYEMRPLYEHYRHVRPVYALDLPGFGLSERSERPYVPRLMCDALIGVLCAVAAEHGGAPVDVIGLSLSAEYVARVAVERPDLCATVALVSPTGFNRPQLRDGAPGTNRGLPTLLAVLNAPGYRRRLYGWLTGRGVIRYFLRRTFGRREIDEGLLDYDCLTAQVPGAEHAPLHFLSGFLFSADSGTVYRQLRQPVWVCHGVRGDFVKYTGVNSLLGAGNWTVDVLDTGALPQFEQLEEFVRRYEAWLARARITTTGTP